MTCSGWALYFFFFALSEPCGRPSKDAHTRDWSTPRMGEMRTIDGGVRAIDRSRLVGSARWTAIEQFWQSGPTEPFQGQISTEQPPASLVVPTPPGSCRFSSIMALVACQSMAYSMQKGKNSSKRVTYELKASGPVVWLPTTRMCTIITRRATL